MGSVGLVGWLTLRKGARARVIVCNGFVSSAEPRNTRDDKTSVCAADLIIAALAGTLRTDTRAASAPPSSAAPASHRAATFDERRRWDMLGSFLGRGDAREEAANLP